ncbi:MAG: hypothetical protein U1E76_21080 [Planctomycetota bacterium]
MSNAAMQRSIDLRTFVYLDVLQPQLASFLATVAQGYLPVEQQAVLYVEVAPGIAINRIADVALKATDARPGMQIVERAYGVLELHSFDHGTIREAGRAVLGYLGKSESDRLQPRAMLSEKITGMSAYHTMLINRMRHGEMILKGETMFVLETHPAGYALLAANEAEKAAPIRLLEVIGFGAFGRLYLGGSEAAVEAAAGAAMRSLAAIAGRANTGGESPR